MRVLYIYTYQVVMPVKYKGVLKIVFGIFYSQPEVLELHFSQLVPVGS